MKALAVSILCFAAALAAAAQTAPHASALGYTYAVPADWTVVDTSSGVAGVKQQVQQNSTDEVDKRGASCVNVSLTARHGEPASVLVIVELPFECLGETATEKDLPGFAQGASEGLKQNFDLTEPATASYKLGTHAVWAERASGSPKGYPDVHYTIEIACSLLKKGAVCWMTMAADADALKVFEAGPVALEGEDAAALVPAAAFDKPH